jgi:uncharacterized cupin superfamily protein
MPRLRSRARNRTPSPPKGAIDRGVWLPLLDYAARMEPFPGVFVSSVSAEAWEPDPEVGGEMHVLCSGHGAESGLSRFAEATPPVRWTLPGRETLLVLEGAARIEIDDGPVLELTAGDIASLPAGARTTWYLTTPFREFWVLTSGPPAESADPAL